ncbi:hypothetical protein [Lonepinella koalarum]|uniref:O-antigen ligase-like membrane protein n=1 Tax=Lonepinella koalarum TaxID=53417 RepID=A0A4R1KSZ2_9PAST|nr:hypothetical protein [Lonepinella koalarum]MDH2927166.1 hypothetical protein [Lonepinella koalarum]TCK68164.1 hypothetical protein EV692_1864 [Lonepinella koalarum]TFJ89444.1 hypothetical protein E0709_08665 [Lonepinella koalarum]
MSALFNLFYLYDPWTFHFIRMSLVAGVIAVLWLAYKWYKKQINQVIIPADSLFVCAALVLVSVIPILINGTAEFGVLSMYIKLLVIFILGIAIYNLFYLQQEKSLFIRDIKIGIVAQSIMGVLALTGIPFLVSIALGTNASAILPRFTGSEQEYRLYNITSSAFFQLSAFYLMLLHFLLAYAEKHAKLQGIYVFLMLCIGLISGRTFLLLSVFSLVLYFKRDYILPIILFGILIFVLAINYQSSLYIEHALEPLINLIYGTDRPASKFIGISTGLSSSTDTLMQKHLFMPGLKQLMIGDGLYYNLNGKGYYGGSDSGFIRQALYGGIGYIAVCFVVTAYFVKRIADNWFNGSWKFILSSLLLLSLLNVKADTYAYPGIMFIFLMFISLFGGQGKQIVRKNHV